MITLKRMLPFVLIAAMASPAAAQEMGKGGGVVSGGAHTEGGGGSTTELEHCNSKLGTLAVAEPQDMLIKSLAVYSLPDPGQMIRLVVQQSGCFAVVERGVAMQNIMQERSLAAGGQLRGNQNIGGRQMVTADYVMTPDVMFKNNDAGGVGGAIGGFFGAIGGLVGGALKFKTAQVTLTMADTRSGLQVAASTGSSKSTDFGLGGILGGSSAVAGLGGYTNTAEGKVVAAAFVDAYNNLVREIKNNPDLQRDNAGLRVGTAGRLKAGGSASAPSAGDQSIGTTRIGNVRVYKTSRKRRVAFTLAQGEQVIILGQEGTKLHIEAGQGSGWVDSSLIQR